MIAHVFVAYMIGELDYGLGSHFKSRFVAKNSNMIPEWRKRVWMYMGYFTLSVHFCKIGFFPILANF